MLFSSIEFIFGFLPIVYILFAFSIRYIGGRGVIVGLTIASLFFYGWWDAKYLLILLASAAGNYASGVAIARSAKWRKEIVTLAITADLLLLAYYKYANFFIENYYDILGQQAPTLSILLPLGISFYTFTQIAFLVDCYTGRATERDIRRYFLFVSYFPHLIAGPVLHNREMMPQFRSDILIKQSLLQNMAIGGSMFAVGLFKKVVIADSLAPLVNSSFTVVHSGSSLGFWESWLAAVGYSLQLYFDFSGYSEMALGLSKMFGIQLPANFNSPYRSRNIIEFWRRWHMTLSTFLRDYLYIPLGGSRKGPTRRYANLLLTMILGGFWHGAGWTFILWGTLHGAYLCVNHGWRHFRRKLLPEALPGLVAGLGMAAATALTLLSVVVAWVFFRAASTSDALSIIGSMSGLNGINTPVAFYHAFDKLGLAGIVTTGPLWPNTPPDLAPATFALSCVVLGFVVVFTPGIVQIMRGTEIALDEGKFEATRVKWSPSNVWAVIVGLALSASIMKLLLGAPTEFLYFQF